MRQGFRIFMVVALAFGLLAGTAAAQWGMLPEMGRKRMSPIAAVDDSGVLYVFGGYTSEISEYTKTAEKYEQGFGWNPIADMPTDLGYGDAVYYDGKVYIPGGVLEEGDPPVSVFYTYDITQDSYGSAFPPLDARFGYTFDEVDGIFYLIGGGNNTLAPQTNCFSYDPSTNSWDILSTMTTPRYGHGSAVIDGKIYVYGGVADVVDDKSFFPTNTVEVYDPDTDTWSALTAMPSFFSEGSAGAADGLAWACHGYQSTGLVSKCHQYDPGTDTWLSGDDAFVARIRIASAASPFYAVGGGTPGTLFDYTPVKTVEGWGYVPDDDDDDSTDDDDDVTDDDDDVTDDDDDVTDDDDDVSDDDDDVTDDDDMADDDDTADDDDDSTDATEEIDEEDDDSGCCG